MSEVIDRNLALGFTFLRRDNYFRIFPNNRRFFRRDFL